MIQDSAICTRILQFETTSDVRPQDEGERFLRTAVRRCVRNAAGQRSPRNQFERFVSDRLGCASSADPSARLTANVSRLADEICHRIRNGRLLEPGMSD